MLRLAIIKWLQKHYNVTYISGDPHLNDNITYIHLNTDRRQAIALWPDKAEVTGDRGIGTAYNNPNFYTTFATKIDTMIRRCQ